MSVFWCVVSVFGGARRDRTADLLRATQALSQLSYGPINRVFNAKAVDRMLDAFWRLRISH